MEELGRPLDAAWCHLLRGNRLRNSDAEAASEALEAAAASFERLGVAHLAERARELVAGSGSASNALLATATTSSPTARVAEGTHSASRLPSATNRLTRPLARLANEAALQAIAYGSVPTGVPVGGFGAAVAATHTNPITRAPAARHDTTTAIAVAAAPGVARRLAPPAALVRRAARWPRWAHRATA